MACFYCKKQGFPNVPSIGPCTECKKEVCVDPPAPERPDGKFHASECRCRCGELVCEYHMQEHAAKEGGTTAGCFPAMALATSSATLRVAATEMGEKRTTSGLSPDSVAAFSQFLSFVTPGIGPLGHAIEQSADRTLLKQVKLRKDPVGDAPFLDFDPEFWSEGAIERVAALASDTLWRAWAGVRQTRKTRLEWLGGGMIRFLTGTDISQAMSERAIEQLVKLVTPAGLPPSVSLIRALNYTTVPEDPDAIASWMVSDTVLVPEPLEMETT
ncbi:MAG: hypothetical protein ACREN5_15310 [Gemmatimonadales bacterium]